MKRNRIAKLPPIAVEERPERLSLTLAPGLKRGLDDFKDFFSSTSGATPTSDNAVIVGILTAYLDAHSGFQRWLKSREKTAAS